MEENMKTYNPSIEDDFKEGDVELGISLISNVNEPAIEIKGVAFNKHEKKMSFKDDKKYRIASPAMIPKSIYRNDEEEYYVKFTEENIEILSKDFMKRVQSNNKAVFNYEHSDVMLDAYILEAYIIDSESKRAMVKSDYNIDVPIGTFFVVQQFNNKEHYKQVVKKDAIGFSIEGYLGMEDLSEYRISLRETFRIKSKNKNKKEKMSKEKNRFFGFKKAMSKKQMLEAIADGNEIIKEDEETLIISEDKELKEGSEVVIISDVEKGAEEDYTGEVEIDKEVLIVDNGTISEIKEKEVKEEVEAEKEEVEAEDEKKEETEMEDEKVEVEAEKEEVEAEDESKEEETEMEDEATLKELYELIGQLRAEIDELKNKEEVVEDEIDDVNFSTDYISALLSYNKKMNS